MPEPKGMPLCISSENPNGSDKSSTMACSARPAVFKADSRGMSATPDKSPWMAVMVTPAS